MTEENLPPQSREAERCVLGSCIRENAVIGDVLQIVRREDFYLDAHQKIFKVISDLYDCGQPVDLRILAEELKLRGWKEDVSGGDYGYIGDLWTAAPTAANAEYYARTVRDKAILRQLIHACTETLRNAYNPTGPASEVLEAAEREIFGIVELGIEGEVKTPAEVISMAYDRIDARKERLGKGAGALATGFYDLDKITGGLHDSELILLAARPSCGKTSLALAIALHVGMVQRRPVLFVSLEQEAGELGERQLAFHSAINSHQLRSGTASADEMKQIIQAGEPLRGSGIFVDDRCPQNMLRLAANARRQKLRRGIGLAIVDYLQLIEPDNPKDPRHEQVTKISRRLKHLARELRIPVVALAQLNRASEDRSDHVPRLSDLRESGSQEQDADVVLLLHRPEVHDATKRPGEVDVIVAKNRNGPTGTARLAFRKSCMRFENFAGP
jgi:replicative DNA helicase